MPGFYAAGEYDVAGTIVGVVDRERILDGSRIAEGDVAVGLPSVGLQTNGYTLARKVFFETLGLAPTDRLRGARRPAGRRGAAGPASVLPAGHGAAARREPRPRHGAPHGRRVLRQHSPRAAGGARRRDQVGLLARAAGLRGHRREGGVSFEEMHRVFNMGIGMVVFVAASDLSRVGEIWREAGVRWSAIGNVRGKGSRRVVVEPEAG